MRAIAEGSSRTLKQTYIQPKDVKIPQRGVTSYHHKLSLRQRESDSKGAADTAQYEAREEKDALLDGFLLLEATGKMLPEDGIMANIEGRGLARVVQDDLSFFTRLEYLNAGENNLQLDMFQHLGELRELRLPCNGMQGISDLDDACFPSLISLDLSYNQLTPDSVVYLGFLPALRDLDLCGNDLRELPANLNGFYCLEKLLLEHNKIESAEALVSLSYLPVLRMASLAYNFLYEFPAEACTKHSFRHLNTLDLSFNYIGSEDSVAPMIQLHSLNTVILYGNPILGPTGEDSMKIYIEDLDNAAIELRLKQGKKEIEIVTEIPKTARQRNNKASARASVYRNFSLVGVKEDVTSKREWREQEAGGSTIFSESVMLARKKLASQEEPSNTFITMTTVVERDIINFSKDADHITSQVVKELGFYRDKEDFEVTKLGDGNGYIPSALMEPVAMDNQDPDGFQVNPMKLKHAMRSLRDLLRKPQSRLDDFRADIHYITSTAASVNRRMPKQQRAKKDAFAADISPRRKGGRKVTEESDRDEGRTKMLERIDDILERVNRNTDGYKAYAARTGPSETLERKAGMGNDMVGLARMLEMVQDVIADLDD